MTSVILSVLVLTPVLAGDSPWKEGAWWEYRDARGKSRKIVVGKPGKIKIEAKVVSALQTEWFGQDAFLIEQGHRDRIVARNRENTLLADFRFLPAKVGPGMNVLTPRVEDVRAGGRTYSCQRFEAGKVIFWVNRAVGVVKCVRLDGTWTLARKGTTKRRN